VDDVDDEAREGIVRHDVGREVAVRVTPISEEIREWQYMQ